MNALESSTRRRYWRETIESSVKTLPAVWLGGIFVVALLGMILVGSELAMILIFVLALVFGMPFAKAVAGELGHHSKHEVKPKSTSAPTTGAQSADPDIERLIGSLDSIEKRLIQLEDIVTDREFSWQRRLNEPRQSSGTAGE